ncbi:uncharacterized protein LOC144100344 isoform X1 [Amblyomma americanum]
MAPVIFVLALLIPAALGSASSDCLNATLPNILNLEKCLGTSLDLCTATVEDVLAAVVKIVVCLVDALLQLSLGCPGCFAANRRNRAQRPGPEFGCPLESNKAFVLCGKCARMPENTYRKRHLQGTDHG